VTERLAGAQRCHGGPTPTWFLLVWQPDGVTIPAIRIEGISAVTLVTGDMGRAVSFYLALGLEMTYGGPAARFTSFRAGAEHINLELGANGVPPNTRWGRVVLWVDDVDAIYRRVVEAGFTPTASPRDASWGERYFHVHDPDGHELSLACPLPATDQRS
jgi:catechol 2,3-dioxygenase-like lactoylglutathione lyase family enzyme